jgi:hypothetical protein
MRRTPLVAAAVGLALVGLPLLARSYRVQTDGESGAPEGTGSSGAPPATTAEQIERIRSIWLECTFGNPGRAERRDCLRVRLAGVPIGPGVLAALFCRDVVLESDVEILAGVALDTWAPEWTLDAVLECAQLCPRATARWPELVEDRCARDARFEERFTRALVESDLFDGSTELLPLRIVQRLARRGDPDLLHALGTGARGFDGGSEAQIALAIETCATLLDRPARLEFLAELIHAPTFAGGETETTTLAQLLLEGPTVALAPQRVFQMMQRLLRDERSRSAAATCVLTLEDWSCLPPELGPEACAALIALAHESAERD